MSEPDLFEPYIPATALRFTLVEIHFDGGCIYRFGEWTGKGYGSYQINTGQIRRVQHGSGMTANAAEVLTLFRAVEEVAKRWRPKRTSLMIVGDSQVALSNAKKLKDRPPFKKSKSHESFLAAQELLHQALKPFHLVHTRWEPRRYSVQRFGH